MNSLTIIIPILNEAEEIENNLRVISDELKKHEIQHHFLIVDDGSTDNSWQILNRLNSELSNLSAVALTRNFGKEQAIRAGLNHCKTDLAVVMDSDLQHPPELIPDMIQLMHKSGSLVIHGRKKPGSDEGHSFLTRVFFFFHKLMTKTDLTNASDFKLLSRPVIDSYCQLPEREVFFRGIIPWLGFPSETIEFSVGKRTQGKSKWNLLSRTLLGIQAIRSFSAAPLQLVTLVGFIFFFGGSILGVITLFQWWNGKAVEGFTTVIILLLIIGSVIMSSLGIIGQYLGEIFYEIKKRPNYLIRDKIDGQYK